MGVEKRENEEGQGQGTPSIPLHTPWSITQARQKKAKGSHVPISMFQLLDLSEWKKQVVTVTTKDNDQKEVKSAMYIAKHTTLFHLFRVSTTRRQTERAKEGFEHHPGRGG